MYPRINYEMTEENEKELLNTCKPTPVMRIGNYTGTTPQENANNAWKALGSKMGFDYMTVRPVNGKGTRYFTAVPSENETQRKERIEKEQREAKRLEVIELQKEIEQLTFKKNSLLKQLEGKNAEDI